MGINITAMLIREDKEIVLKKMLSAFGIVLERLPDERWGDHYLGYSHYSRNEHRMLVYAKNGSTVIYGDLSDAAAGDYKDRQVRFLKTFRESAAFEGSETSMAFYFRFYEGGKTKSRDFYLFEEDFTVKGKNILNLGENDDMIFDGFLPLVDSYLGETAEDDPVEIYRLINPDHLRWEIRSFSAQSAVPDGCAALIELRDRQAEYERLAGAPTVSASHVTDMTAFLKTSLWHHAELWERSDLGKEEADQFTLYRGYFASLWVQRGLDIQHERFHVLYRQLKEIVWRETEPQAYEQLEVLKGLMRELMDLGYFYDTRLAEKLEEPQVRNEILSTAHELARQWQKGLTGSYAFRNRLEQVAQYLAWADLTPAPKKWWKFW